MDRESLAWAAGLFDGEGTFGSWGPWSSLRGNVSQYDRRVLDRFNDALGVGNVYGPSSRGEFKWQVGGDEKVQATIAMLWPWLGEVKCKQALDALLKRRTYLSTREALLEKNQPCTGPNCVRLRVARGLCSMHYQRTWKAA